MRHALIVVLLAACASSPVVPSGGAEVRALIDAQVAAWNRGDLEGFCAGYAEDATFVSPSGVTRGRAEVLARYQKKYGREPASMGRLELTPFDVREAEGAVSVAATWTLSWADRPAATGSTVIVFARVGGRWVIVHDASM